ncbi:hypothetical protein ORJ04_10000 [Rheinheimera baltica]|uniref:Uncharacterized protein n=1 Tax=Rheinheimera baltica TaxID=67576 RepID=A0ABT9HYR4_9GAMM|nr:hypothetical protein [Rheinheimera baltica]MDP5136283.1 hypothetical protein [Rheinheimera baltica]
MANFDRPSYFSSVSEKVLDLESKYKIAGFMNANADIANLIDVIDTEGATVTDKSVAAIIATTN